MAAIVAGDIAGIITSSVGFIPGGDFLKAYNKTETALTNTRNISSGSVDNIMDSADGKIINAGLTNNKPVDNAITNAGAGVQPQITNTTTQVTNQTTPNIQAGSGKYKVLTKSEMQALLDKDVSQLSDAEKILVEAYKKQVQGKNVDELFAQAQKIGDKTNVVTSQLTQIQQDISQALQAKGLTEQDLILQIAKDKGIENEMLTILKSQNFNPDGFIDFVKDMDDAKLKRLKGMAIALDKNPKMVIKLSTEKAAPKPAALFTNQLEPEIAAIDSKLSSFIKEVV